MSRMGGRNDQGATHDRESHSGRQGRQRGHHRAHRDLAAAAKILAERRIGALVVTGPEQRVVGIVSERDIVRDARGARRGMRSTCR